MSLYYWITLLLALGVYLGMNAHFLNAVLPPRPPEDCTWLKTIVGHWLPQVLVLSSLVLLVQVVVAPLLLLTATLYLLLTANNKKATLLQEPLLPSDIAAVARHPQTWRLLARYVERPLLSLAIAIAALAFTVAELKWESWLLTTYWPSLAVISWLPVAIAFVPWRGQSLLGRLFTACGLPFYDWNLPVSLSSSGFLPTFLRCIGSVPRPAVRSMTTMRARAVLERAFREDGEFCKVHGRRPLPAEKPHIVVVVSEAFFDPASVGLSVTPDPLVHFRQAAQRSLYAGCCEVPTYGGWTVRSEYSLLTGVSMQCFANDVGNPNATLVRGATHSLPKYLQTRGYRTAILHPYDARFYRRDNASRSLGFDVFLDEQTFPGAAREGRYIADMAVAERIEQELKAASEPTFLFCITMENHGPWTEELPPNSEPSRIEPALSPSNASEFASYLHHLRNADRMVGRLSEVVAAVDRPTLLLFLGDHLPALTSLFCELGHGSLFLSGKRAVDLATCDKTLLRTPYCLLSNTAAEPRPLNCDVSYLAGLLLDCAGLNDDEFFRFNSAMRRYQEGDLNNPSTDSKVRRAHLRLGYDMAVSPEACKGQLRSLGQVVASFSPMAGCDYVRSL